MDITIDNKIDEDEIKMAEAEAEESSGFYTLKLKKPINYEDTELTELHFDFEKLTGKDSLAIERELQMKGRPVVVREISNDYQLLFAVKACREKVSADYITALPVKAYMQVTNAARSFLLRAE